MTTEESTNKLSVHGVSVVDIDSHYTEPADLWTSRAPGKYKSLVPRVEERSGAPRWIVDEDIDFGPLGFTVVKEDGSKAYGTIGLTTYEEMDAAATDPKARLKLLDRLGISQQIVYPNVVGFGSNRFMDISDKGLRTVCAQVYNDALLELQSAGEERLFPQAVVPFWDVKEAVEEIERVCGDGQLKGITMTDSPDQFGQPFLNDPYWDPFWDTCVQLGIPVNFHIGSSSSSTGNMLWAGYGPERSLAITSIALFLGNFRVIINLIFSGLLERYPSLNFVSVESGIGWIPFLLEAMDYQFEETVPSERDLLKMKPSDYFKRQIKASFWFEDFGPRAAIETIGEDSVMFETDFPHPTCLYPKAQEHITEVLTDLDEGVRRKVLHDTAADLYNLPEIS